MSSASATGGAADTEGRGCAGVAGWVKARFARRAHHPYRHENWWARLRFAHPTASVIWLPSMRQTARRDDDTMPLFCPTSQTEFQKSEAPSTTTAKPLILLSPATVHGVVFAFVHFARFFPSSFSSALRISLNSSSEDLSARGKRRSSLSSAATIAEPITTRANHL